MLKEKKSLIIFFLLYVNKNKNPTSGFTSKGKKFINNPKTLNLDIQTFPTVLMSA